jgi:taurine dioxygenase
MNFTVNPLSPALGAEIIGLDLAAELGEDAFAELRKAWLNAGGVAVVRDQTQTPEQHIAFSKRFGVLEEHVLAKYLLPGHPEIYRVSNKVRNGEPQGREKAGTYWHSDLSYMRPPALASLLYAIEIPPTGGDTMFASMTAAHDALSPAMREMIAGLSAVHDFGYASRSVFKGERATADQLDAAPAVTHPVVKIHPETGRAALYVNPGFTSHITGLAPDESKAILDFLFRHSTRPEFIYRHRWQLHDLVIWDNRCTMHYAVADYDAVGERYMHRTTVMCADN